MVDRRTTLWRLGLVWTAQHPHVTPATTISARICIRPVLPSFLYFPYAGLTCPILLDSRISLVALPQLISFWCRWTTAPTTLMCRLLLLGNGITMNSEEEATTFTAGARPSQPVGVPTTTAETPTIDGINPVYKPPLPQIGPVSTRPTRFETFDEIKQLLCEQAASLSNMMVSVMAEQQARQDAQAAFFAEQLKLIRQERGVKTELAPTALSIPPATSELDGGSSCTSCLQLVAAADPNLNEETCPQLATAVQDMQRQVKEIQVQVARKRVEAAKQPRVAFPMDGVPLGTRDRRRRLPSKPRKRLEEFEYRRETTGWSDEEGPVCTGRSCKTSCHSRNHKHRHCHSRGNSTSSSESED